MWACPRTQTNFVELWILFQIPCILATKDRCSSLLGFLMLSLPVAIETFMLRPWNLSKDLENRNIVQLGPTCSSSFKMNVKGGALWWLMYQINLTSPCNVTVKQNTWAFLCLGHPANLSQIWQQNMLTINHHLQSKIQKCQQFWNHFQNMHIFQLKEKF